MGKARWRQVVETAIPQYKRELPASTIGGDWIFENAVKPTSEMEALMMTPPGGHEPLLAPDHQDDPYRALEANLGVSLGLTEFEKGVLDARVVSGLSYRAAAEMLGCAPSTVHKVYHGTIEKIQTAYREATDPF